jgi:hypothetical protein
MATGRLIPAAPFRSGTVTFEAYLSALPARVDR